MQSHVRILTPVTKEGEAPIIDPKCPVLSATNVDDTEKAKTIQRCLLSETLLPLVASGERQGFHLTSRFRDLR